MIRLRIPEHLLRDVLDDLGRPHEFAFERIGYIACKQATTPQGLLLLAYDYLAVSDDAYLRDETVGVRFDASAIRAGMQLSLTSNASVFHVHLHEHRGIPRMSRVDAREMQRLMPCFVNVCPQRVHGAVVLSIDSAYARAWGANLPTEGAAVNRITAISNRVRLLS